MSKATYWQRGETLDYVNETTAVIEAGTILPIGGRIGIAGTSINPNEKGSIHVTGVFVMDKTSDAEIRQGTAVYFDGAGITDQLKTGDKDCIPAGYAAQTAGASTRTILVKLPG